MRILFCFLRHTNDLQALTQGLQQVLGSTILVGLMAALQLPVVLTKLAYLIDNPWTVSLDRANMAGLILADSIIERNLGTRPVTFVGYSLGSRVIFSCLRELARKGAFGLVQNVYLFGSPIVAKRDEYLKARSVVAGRFVNGYAKTDWILGYLFRLTSGGISRIAGLAPVEEVPGLENVDVTEFVPGHMSYRTAMPKLLREVGWSVESDEFTEIEDPDPEDHQKRQRELINEIEEARKDFERKESKGRGLGGFFSRKKKDVVKKEEWETYQDSKPEDETSSSTTQTTSTQAGVLFDVDAIRAELAGENMQVRELKSTLPPMRLNMTSTSGRSSPSFSPRSTLHSSKSFDTSSALSPRANMTSPRSPSYGFQNEDAPSPHGHRTSEISMSFEPYTNTAHSSPSFPQSRVDAPLPSLPREGSSSSLSTAYASARSRPPSRPGLKSTNTLPLGAGVGVGMGVGGAGVTSPMHNAWAEDEEEEFGEREIEMSFA